MKKRVFARKVMGVVLAAALSVGMAAALHAEEEKSVAIDKEAFDELIASGITADDADIEASE